MGTRMRESSLALAMATVSTHELLLCAVFSLYSDMRMRGRDSQTTSARGKTFNSWGGGGEEKLPNHERATAACRRS
jgi:hypothetical protein